MLGSEKVSARDVARFRKLWTIGGKRKSDVEAERRVMCIWDRDTDTEKEALPLDGQTTQPSISVDSANISLINTHSSVAADAAGFHWDIGTEMAAVWRMAVSGRAVAGPGIL